MEMFSEFEKHRRLYLIEYYKPVFKSAEENNILNYLDLFTNKYFFILSESFTAYYLYNKILKKPILSNSHKFGKFSMIFSALTLLNMNIFLRNFKKEYPFYENDFNLEKLKLITDDYNFTSDLECFMSSYTSPGFCIIKDALLIRFISLITLPITIYQNYQKLSKKPENF